MKKIYLLLPEGLDCEAFGQQSLLPGDSYSEGAGEHEGMFRPDGVRVAA